LRRVLIGLSALLFFGCPKPQENTMKEGAKLEPTTTSAENKVPQKDFISLAHNGDLFMGKPPLKIFYFDAVFTNNASEPRWVLFPDSLPESVGRPDGGVDAIEVFQPKGTGKAIALNLMGTNMYGWAVLLPPKAEVKMKRLPIEVWESEIPTKLEIKTILASGLTLNGKPATSFLKADPTCDTKAEGEFEKSKAYSMIDSVHFSEDLKEVPIQYKTEQTATLTVSIVKK
jgi:hypothetical protein